MKLRKTLKILLATGAVAAFAVALSGCADTSSTYNTRDVTYKHHGRVKVVNKTSCVDGDCQYVKRKVKHKRSGKTVVVKKTCDDQGNCYKTKHHHW